MKFIIKNKQNIFKFNIIGYNILLKNKFHAFTMFHNKSVQVYISSEEIGPPYVNDCTFDQTENLCQNPGSTIEFLQLLLRDSNYGFVFNESDQWDLGLVDSIWNVDEYVTSFPYDYDPTYLVVPVAQPTLLYHLFAVYRVFSVKVWLAFILLSLVIIAILIAFQLTSNSKIPWSYMKMLIPNQEIRESGKTDQLRKSTNLLCTIYAVFFGVLFISQYESALLTSIVAPSPKLLEKSTDQIMDLIKNGELKLITEGDWIDDYAEEFKNNKVLQKLAQAARNNLTKMVPIGQEWKKYLSTGEFCAVYDQKDLIWDFNRFKLCQNQQWQAIKIDLYNPYWYLLYHQNVSRSARSRFDAKIIQAQGEFHFSHKHIFDETAGFEWCKKQFVAPKKGIYEPLTMELIGGAFVILLIGVPIAIVWFFAEQIQRFRKKNTKSLDLRVLRINEELVEDFVNSSRTNRGLAESFKDVSDSIYKINENGLDELFEKEIVQMNTALELYLRADKK